MNWMLDAPCHKNPKCFPKATITNLKTESLINVMCGMHASQAVDTFLNTRTDNTLNYNFK